MSSLHISSLTKSTDYGVVEKKLPELVALEEDHFVLGFHQQVQKVCEKAWHDRHIKHKKFQMGDLVFLYDSKFFKHLGKFQIHLLDPYMIRYVREVGFV
jgi:hypothetical protein